MALDMETSNPDDFIILLGHPMIHIEAVTAVRCTSDQIGFLRYVLGRFNQNFILRYMKMFRQTNLNKHLMVAIKKDYSCL
ncbi:unnamed protein product [Rotaria sp. Silwood2]|nr:unnamed protein product [Rotaria sp. Silwood2]